MGTFSKGLFGAFRGKVGSMVGSIWKGKEVLRSKPAGGRTRFSPDQLQQQAKFSVMVKFLKPLAALLNRTYGPSAVQMTGFNKALSFNIRNAITGQYPAFTVDYPMVQLSQGLLTSVASAAGSSAAAGKLTLAWADNSGKGTALPDDEAYVAAYCADLDDWLIEEQAGTRSAGTLTLDAPDFSGKAVQVYFGFRSVKGQLVSNGLYAGQVNML